MKCPCGGSDEMCPCQNKPASTGGSEMSDDTTILPDGSAFFTTNLPLPKDHWIYGGGNTPPMPLRMPASPERDEMVSKIWEAGKYAVRVATMHGREDDFDPDALVQNLVVGLLGYHSADGLSHDLPDDDPKPVPLVFVPGWMSEK